MTHHNKYWNNDCMSCKFNTPKVCFDNFQCIGCSNHNDNGIEPRCKCFEENEGQEHCPHYKGA